MGIRVEESRVRTRVRVKTRMCSTPARSAEAKTLPRLIARFSSGPTGDSYLRTGVVLVRFHPDSRPG